MKTWICFAIAVLGLLCAGRASAGTFNTDVHKDSGTYTVHFNNAFEIRHVVAVSSNTATTAGFPKGVRMLNDSAKRSVTEALSMKFNGKPVTSQVSYKIASLTLSADSNAKIKAHCVVVFNDDVEITLGILGKENKHRIVWPEDVRFKNQLLRKMVAKSRNEFLFRLYKAYPAEISVAVAK